MLKARLAEINQIVKFINSVLYCFINVLIIIIPIIEKTVLKVDSNYFLAPFRMILDHPSCDICGIALFKKNVLI